MQFGDLPVYIKSLDDGTFCLGAPHDEGDTPSPEEIFTAFPSGTNKISLKSGYGKYLGVDSKYRLVGVSDAIGELLMPLIIMG